MSRLSRRFDSGLPVLAMDAGAVPETMDSAGVLIREKRLDEIALMAHAIVSDPEVSARIVASQDAALERTDARDNSELLEGFINQAMGATRVSK